MSSYLVLARKYRPQQFVDIVGQTAVVRTLMNAIRLNRTHQATLFCGSRGIGKTSIARIYAKALRCPERKEIEGVITSCGVCSDCVEITAGQSVNVIEIDGASNNGVDHIRELRENAQFLPSSGSLKIFIIDEVHMLTTQSFNALLKILEEPPAHVMFIFATTEAYKIPETILGRCQRFDFKRVTPTQIVDRLHYVLTQEGIAFEMPALSAIAKAADGSMRDALSITDQVIAFDPAKVSANSVRDSIGLVGTDRVFALMQAVLKRDAGGALQIVEDSYDQGYDLKILLKSLIECWHALVMLQIDARVRLDFPEDELAQMKSMIHLRELEENELIFQVFNHGYETLGNSSQPKIVMDFMIVKVALAEVLIEIDVVDTAVDTAISVPVLAGPSGKAKTPGPAARDSSGPVSQGVAPDPVRVKLPDAGVTGVVTEQKSAATPITSLRATGAPIRPAPQVFAPPSSKVDTPPQVVSTVTAPAHPPQLRSWDDFVAYAGTLKPVVAMMWESAVEWTLPQAPGDVLRIGFREKDKTKIEQLQLKFHKEAMSGLVESYFGFRAPVEFFISSTDQESALEKRERLAREAYQKRVDAVMNHPVVVEVQALFGTKLSPPEFRE